MSEHNISVLIVCSTVVLIVFLFLLFSAIRRKREMATRIVELIDRILDVSIYQAFYLLTHGELPPEPEDEQSHEVRS